MATNGGRRPNRRSIEAEPALWAWVESYAQDAGISKTDVVIAALEDARRRAALYPKPHGDVAPCARCSQPISRPIIHAAGDVRWRHDGDADHKATPALQLEPPRRGAFVRCGCCALLHPAESLEADRAAAEIAAVIRDAAAVSGPEAARFRAFVMPPAARSRSRRSNAP
jgi:hypothetical protein